MSKEEVLAALRALSPEDRQWVLNENMHKEFKRIGEAMNKFAEVFRNLEQKSKDEK